jgi:hypothetical protein
MVGCTQRGREHPARQPAEKRRRASLYAQRQPERLSLRNRRRIRVKGASGRAPQRRVVPGVLVVSRIAGVIPTPGELSGQIVCGVWQDRQRDGLPGC